jgi:hypothetical protein
MNGYMLFARNRNNMCSIANYAVYPILGTSTNPNNNQNNNQNNNLAKRLRSNNILLLLIINIMFLIVNF